MNVIVHENADGTVSITTMDPNFFLAETKKGKTEAQILAEHEIRLANENPTAVVHGQIDPATLPDNAGAAMEHVLDEATMSVGQAPYADQRRCFRDQWVWNGSAVVEDAVKVLAEKSRKARAVRNRMLALTDSEEFRLTGPALADSRAWRQSLRDLGATIDVDPDNVVWPAKPVS